MATWNDGEPNDWLLALDSRIVAEGAADLGRRILYDKAVVLGDCDACGGPLSTGQTVVVYPKHGQTVCERCAGGEEQEDR